MALAKYPLHRSGLQITRVGFGSWAAGGGGWAFGWGPQDDRESLAAMRHAIDLGQLDRCRDAGEETIRGAGAMAPA
jgi:hypothetical protein